jgi:hypothetical protein
MAVKLGVLTRNARLDAIETYIGTGPTLKIFSGAPPANCAAEDSGTLLATITLPSNWLADAASGAKALAGTWQDASADDTGVAGHFRIYKSAACEIQGTAGETGDAPDLVLDNKSINAGQQVTITAFTLTDGNG